MKYLNYYDKLSNEDVREVEKYIKDWAKRNPNGILLINQNTLNNLRCRLKQQPGKTQHVVSMLQMENIDIGWINIGGEKAILNIIQDNNGKLLYKQPASWKDAELWYQFK